MKDSRITVWTNPTTINTDTTTYGPWLDLLDGVTANNHDDGTNECGLTVQVICSTWTNGTSTISFQTSADKATIFDDTTMGQFTTATGKLAGTVRTRRQYIRMKVVSSDSCDQVLKMWADDSLTLMGQPG